ncbi:MAG: ATP-binding protein [bacterium]
MSLLAHYVIALLTTSVTIFLLALLVYLKGHKKQTNLIFTFYSLTVAIWSIGHVFHFSSSNKTIALFWARFMHIGVIFISTSFVHFVLTIVNISERKRKKILVTIYFLSLLFLGLNFTDFFIPSVSTKFVFRYCYNVGPAYIPFLVFWIGSIIYGHYILFRAYFTSEGRRRNQLAYLCWSSALGYIGGAGNFLPAFNIHLYPYNPFGTYAVPLYMAAMTYSIIKHQLLDIELVITRATVFTFFYGITFGLPFVLFSLFQRQIYPIYQNNPWAIPVSIVGYSAFAAISPFLYMRLERKAYHTFFGDYSAQLKILTETSRDIIEKGFENSIELAQSIPASIMEFYEKVMKQKISQAIYLLRDGKDFIVHKADKHEGEMRIKNNAAIIKWFTNTKNLLVQKNIINKNELPYMLGKDDLELWLGEVSKRKENEDITRELYNLHNQMNQLECIIFFPSYYKDELLGILALGEKKGGYYRKEELEVFHTLAENTAMVLKGAQLTASMLEAEKTREIEQAKSELFSNVSHELRTPLTNIIIPIESAMNQNNITLRKARDIFKMVLINSRKLLKEINVLLDISKLEAGKIKLRFVLKDINSVMRIIIEPARELAKAKRIKLIENYTSNLESIYIDTDYLGKALGNLINNGLKFTPAKGTITIMTEEDDDYLKIIISDTGIGIDEKDLPYIFDRFRQADGSISRRFEGTGIGLSLAKDIILLHKGTIEVESTKETGSIFTVRLPKGRTHLNDEDILDIACKEEIFSCGVSLQYSDLISASIPSSCPLPERKGLKGFSVLPQGEDFLPRPQGEGRGEGTQHKGKQYKVLLVEDNKDLALNIKNILQDYYDIRIAANGKEGLENVLQEKPDIIISDIMMPEMDGYELCKEIKSNPETEFIPVILLTAKAKLEDKITGMRYGVDRYIIKPFYYRELLVTVSCLIEQGELKKALKNKSEELQASLKELKEIESQLVHSAKLAAVGQLAAGVAHEISNPVSFVDKWLEAIRRILEKVKTDQISFTEGYEELSRILKRANESIIRIKDIINSLLTFSRKNREGRNKVNLYEGIDSTLVLLNNQLRQDQITVEKSYTGLDNIEADLQQLNQVFFNLLSNAIDSINEAKRQGKATAGHIKISTCPEKDSIILSVKDDGLGIPDKIKDKIFDPFFTTKDVGKGTGLGLHISYHIIQDHGGEIEVKSVENEGAEFIIKLPKFIKNS